MTIPLLSGINTLKFPLSFTKSNMRSSLVFISFFSAVWCAPTPTCPAGYASTDQRTCYKIYHTPATKNDAEAHCATDGGYLSSNRNGFANSEVMSFGKNASVATVWLGIECFHGDPTSCVNDDGTKFGPYDSFYPNNPSDVGNCIGMSLLGRSTGYWFSYECENLFPFVCEYPYLSQFTSTRSPLVCPNGYTVFEGACYKWVGQSMNRFDASTNCKKTPGGNLATIANHEVNDFMSILTNGTSYNSWIGLQCPNRQYNTDRSSCVWDDGTPFAYDDFYSGWPSWTDGYDCVVFLGIYWYNDITCYDKADSICQAPASLP